MAGISKHINATATKSLMRIKESPIHNITAKHYRQLMASLIAGTHRAMDRLSAAGITEHDTCEVDGCRHTSEHVIWECKRWAKLRAAYMKKINDTLWVAEHKVGKDTVKYLRKLLATPAFRHNGIVNADTETMEWAAAQDTRSTCPLDECHNCIKRDNLAEFVTVDGCRLMVVFTDGSANAINTDCLAYGGWGFYIHKNSEHNTGGGTHGQTYHKLQG